MPVDWIEIDVLKNQITGCRDQENPEEQALRSRFSVCG
ncbi:hypothetical protein ASZ90_011696 [hydrocarbon metagenome]|uniref:Uncharacterized protein n=1 Tax=hydrocarbon metagenome TaxID=938273 RepID=A0A0W8FCD9_9ZZZZ